MKPIEPGSIFVLGCMLGIIIVSIYVAGNISKEWYFSIPYVVGSIILILWLGAKINMKARSLYR